MGGSGYPVFLSCVYTDGAALCVADTWNVEEERTMGCWGITAFESDAGLDAVIFIRENLPKDGKLVIEKIIEALKGDVWNAPSEVSDGEAHTSPMALAEVMLKCMDQDMENLDLSEAWAADDKKFSDLTSFSASKESIQWLRNYLADTLVHAREHGQSEGNKRRWNGWFQEKDWIGWQEHMEMLVNRLDTLCSLEENQIDLLPFRQKENCQVLKG